MKKISFLVALIFVLSVSLSAFAFECDISHDASKYEIILKGTSRTPFSVTVMPAEDNEIANISSDAAQAIAQYDFHTETDFEETLSLSPVLSSGEYAVRVRTNEQYMEAVNRDGRLYGEPRDNDIYIEEKIYHIHRDDGAELLSALNAATTAPILRTVISTGTSQSGIAYSELLAIDSAAFSAYGSYATKQMTATKNGAVYESITEFKKLLEEYRVLYNVTVCPSGAEAALKIMEDNPKAFSADIGRFVSLLDSPSKEKLFTLIKAFNANGESFSSALPMLSALATVQAADRWQKIKTVVTDTYDDILRIDYNVANRDKVFQKMTSYSYITPADIASNFAKADAEVNKKPVEKPSSSVSTSPSGSFEVAPPRDEQRGESAVTFTDVGSDFWAYDAISTLSAKNIITGYPDKTFMPANDVTRAEFVKMLVSAFAINGYSQISFDDVAHSDWHYEYILKAHGAGLVNGIGENSFMPNAKITREDACVIVHRYLSGLGILAGNEKTFSDEASFSDYSKAAIKSLAGNNVINGVGGGIFAPKANINRASCAQLILNCMKAVGY